MKPPQRDVEITANGIEIAYPQGVSQTHIDHLIDAFESEGR